MTDFLIKFVVWTEYIIPIITVAIFVLVGIIYTCIKAFVWHMKISWLKSHGYERYLRDVSSCGNGTFYSWKNKQTGKQVDERSLKWMSYSDLIKNERSIRGDSDGKEN